MPLNMTNHKGVEIGSCQLMNYDRYEPYDYEIKKIYINNCYFCFSVI